MRTPFSIFVAVPAECLPNHISAHTHTPNPPTDPHPLSSTHTASLSCTEGEVRLVDGGTQTEGRVELCQSQVWFTLSADGWGTEEAEVVCRQLGMSGQGLCTCEAMQVIITHFAKRKCLKICIKLVHYSLVYSNILKKHSSTKLY